MSEFSVDTLKLKNNANELDSLGKKLRQTSSRILTIQEELDIYGEFRFEILKALNKCEASLIEKAIKQESLSKALYTLIQNYESNERIICGSANIIERLIDKCGTDVYNIASIFGLDDDIYSTIIGYEKYDGERTQEKLMDQYLQEEVNEILQKPCYSKETWDRANPQQREKMLEDLVKELNQTMGLDVNEDVIVENKLHNTSTRGQYNSGTNSVYVNPDYLNSKDDSSYNILQTTVHEMRHAYQHNAINQPDNYIVSQETREQWDNNFKNYKGGSKYSYEEYVTQPIEWDAKNFAGQKGDVEGYTPKYAGSWD